MEQGQERIQASRIRIEFNKVKYICYKSCGSNQDWKLTFRVLSPI